MHPPNPHPLTWDVTATNLHEMSSDLGGAAGEPIERKDLLDYFHAACSRRQGRRMTLIGVEQELLPVHPETGEACSFQDGGERAFLGLMGNYGYTPPEGVVNPTTLYRGAASVDLEPGAQMEVSGTPYRTLAEVDAELREVLIDFADSAADAGFCYLSHGSHPITAAADVVIVPKRRYGILIDYFKKYGLPRYRDMMTQTGSVQASFDYEDEADAGRKMRLGTLAAPFATALFANSPFEKGRPGGALCHRGIYWRESIAGRSGPVRQAVEGEWSFDRYVDFLIQAPTIFVRADDGGVSYAGNRPFVELLDQGFEGRRLTKADWELQLSGLWPVARMKKVIEVRSCDGPPPQHNMSVPAFWMGLLYHRPAVDAATELLMPFWPRFDDVQLTAIQHGVKGDLGNNVAMGDILKELLAASRAGLQARNLGEERYLDVLDEIVATGRTWAEQAIEIMDREGIAGLIKWARVAGSR